MCIRLTHSGISLTISLKSVEIVLIAIELRMIDYGFGRHVSSLQVDKILILAKMNWAGDFVYDTALFLSKIAALLFLARVFPRTANSKWFNYGLWATFGLTVAWLVGTYLATIFFCWPISKNWISTEPGYCGTELNLLVCLN